MPRQQISEKRFWVQRLSKTALRALHILGIAGAGGGILLNIDKSLWLNYWYLAMSTGSILMLWEIMRDWRWLIQLKGVLTLGKLGLLCALCAKFILSWVLEESCSVVALGVAGPAC